MAKRRKHSRSSRGDLRAYASKIGARHGLYGAHAEELAHELKYLEQFAKVPRGYRTTFVLAHAIGKRKGAARAQGVADQFAFFDLE